MPGRRTFTPFESRGRLAIGAILATIAFVSIVTVGLSIRATQRSQHKASVVEAAARQRMLAERYVGDVLLVTTGRNADPVYTGELLRRSTKALLDGGTAPAVPGDDDETKLTAERSPTVRRQLMQELRLVADLTATGGAILADRPTTHLPTTAGEHLAPTNSVERLRVLAALTSNVSLNAARTIATNADDNVNGLITTEEILGGAGLLISLALALALIAVTRRQTAHFRSLITSSTDLVLVFGDSGCRYASRSVTEMLGRETSELVGGGFFDVVDPDDVDIVRETSTRGDPAEIVFRVRNRFAEWRHLEAHVTDLRSDRWVRSVVLNARDVTERVQLEEELTRQAFHDSLTALPNRALFRDRLDQALVRSLRSEEKLAVLLLDLDGFKQVNDSLGHDAGDHLLRVIASRLDEVGRPSDTLARLGGDEFAILIEGAGETQAVAYCERLLEVISNPVSVAGRELSVGASIGIVIHPGGEGDSPSLIRDADVAMYAAKESGRGTHQLFKFEMGRKFGDVLGLEHELRLALRQDELKVHYQPEIDLKTNGVVGVEALLRWNSATRGQVPPARFIPIAESSGLIFPIGEFVLGEACRQTAEWRRQGLLSEDFVTWVNLSATQLSTAGVSDLVTRELAAAELPASFLGLEVTETAIVRGASSQRASAELQELHDLGVRIAIDDFGTGFSSLGQLRHFPVDMLKVDRSFVQGVEHSAKDAAITSNLVSLAHALGVTAIAEGIESDAQRRSLEAVGCDYAQGFLFAHPVSAEEAGRVIATGVAPPGAPSPPSKKPISAG
ncbi:MAG TPA: EAL domain-containing protein [Solirubrobacterales bacterium]|nr:EAL domain-containing protein [Solirubrobacterales bacterium]